MFKRIVTAALIFGMAAIAPPAQAQVACAKRTQITSRLTERFGETPVGIGLSSATQIIEVWASEQTQTWTILLTDTHDRSCVIASGTAWTGVPAPNPGKTDLTVRNETN